MILTISWGRKRKDRKKTYTLPLQV
uniref:Uncharacterized protein n=1 Tax=Rhizophora mucronata TaxID=61149 RepID=A0A2P2PEP1_RHIMU